MRSLFAFLLLSIAANPAQAAESISCHLQKYYPKHGAIDGSAPALEVNVNIESNGDGLVGTVVVMGHNPAIGFTEAVRKSAKPYVLKENMLLDNSLRSAGINFTEVKTVENYEFGSSGNMGPAAFMHVLKDKDGKEIDKLFFLWGASGYGSCKLKKALAIDLD